MFGAAALWDFMAGRGAQEKTYGELKGEWAFDVIPTRHYGANSAWQQICVLGHNLLRNFQLQTVATQKPRSRKRTYCFFTAESKDLTLQADSSTGSAPEASRIFNLAFLSGSSGPRTHSNNGAKTKTRCLNQ